MRPRGAMSTTVLTVCGCLALFRQAAAQDTPLAVREERAFQQAAAAVDPSIVRIETVGGADVIGKELAAEGPTTGVVVGADGWVITSSFNFAARPTSIFVILSDGRRFPARLVGRDESRRLTLLKIDAAGLKPLEAVPRDEMRVGQWAIALGRTFEPEFPNIAVGIISALHRISGRAIQTDANTSPVNYGGPLVNIEGRGLGIIVPLSAQNEGVTAGVDYYDSGIGFAVPLSDVLAVLDRLQAGETLKSGKLGIFFDDHGALTGEVVISRIHPRSPAEAAGLQVGDVIIGIDGQTVDRAATMRQLIGPRYAGDHVVLTLRRKDQTLDAPVTLTDEIIPFEPGVLGLLLERRPIAAEPAEPIVRHVFPGSAAAQAGLQSGDRLLAVDGASASSPAELRRLLRNHAAGDVVTLSVAAQAATRSLTVKLTPLPSMTPDVVPPQPIPTGAEPAADAPPVGRLVSAVVGDERRYWAYVPEHSNRDWAYGLVVWLQPQEDRREAATLESWRRICDERGLVLVAPPAGPQGWTGGDLAYVAAVVSKLRQEYKIDAARIAAVGEARGGNLAISLAVRQRELFSGVAAIGMVPPDQLGDPDSEHPLRLHISAFADDPQARKIERALEPLRKLKIPIVFRRWSGDGRHGIDEAAADELGRWVDSLDSL